MDVYVYTIKMHTMIFITKYVHSDQVSIFLLEVLELKGGRKDGY